MNLKIYTLEKGNLAEMGQVLVLELISPAIKNKQHKPVKEKKCNKEHEQESRH